MKVSKWTDVWIAALAVIVAVGALLLCGCVFAPKTVEVYYGPDAATGTDTPGGEVHVYQVDNNRQGLYGDVEEMPLPEPAPSNPIEAVDVIIKQKKQ